MGSNIESSSFINALSPDTLRAFIQEHPWGIISTDANGNIKFINPAAQAILSNNSDFPTKQHINQLLNSKNSVTNIDFTQFIDTERNVIAGHKIKHTLVHNDNSETPLIIHFNQIGENGHTRIFYFIEDITEQVELQQKLYEQAITDPLTGIFNRRYFDDRLNQEFKRANRHHRPFSTVIIDIDGFKQANDLHGHPFGDELLIKATQTFKQFLRKEDSVYRYGGDEFAMLLPETTKEGAIEVAERLRNGFIKNRISDERRIKLSLSIGISSFPEDGTNEKELIGAADQRMYHSKESGGNVITAYDSLIFSDHDIETMLKSLGNLAHLMEKYRGYHTDGLNHSQSLRTLAIAIGKKMNLSKEQLILLEQASLLHDIGTVYIPAEVLKKNGELNENEWEDIKRHTLIGEEIIEMVSPSENIGMQKLKNIVGQHHERLDGSGYPRGLRNEQILLEAQIIAVSDSYTAMLSKRPYRNAYTRKQALANINHQSGTAFHPGIVAALNEIESPHL